MRRRLTGNVEDELEEAQQKVFRELLESRLEALLSKAGSHIGSLVERRDMHADAADVAAEESTREFELRMHEHDRATIQAIRQALRRMDNGEYGECVACGEEIGHRRLMARPMATHCIDCMTEIELRAR